MGNSFSGEGGEEFTIERASTSVRVEKKLNVKFTLTPAEQERIKDKKEQLRIIQEHTRKLTLRSKERHEMSQKLAKEFKSRIGGAPVESKRKDARTLFQQSKQTVTPQRKKQILAATKIQATWRGHRIRRVYGMMGKRTLVAKELLETEKDYIQYLSALASVYYQPLREKAESETPLLTMEEVRQIFPQIEVLLLYNTKLYALLEERIRQRWNAEQTVGDIFLELYDFLRQPYTQYISQFPHISQQIKTTAKRIRVHMFYQKNKNVPECGGLDLQALASMPFQRIPRYILLLKELMSNTHKTHPDYEHLKNAIDKMDFLAKTANERLREQETQRNIVEIAKRLDPPVTNLLKPFRKLIKEGAMRYKINAMSSAARRMPTNFRACKVFLFTDCLLVAEPITSVSSLFDSAPKLRPIDVLGLRNSTVLDLTDESEMNNDKYNFRVHSLQTTIIFEVDDETAKEAWINDIVQVINNLTEMSISQRSRINKRRSVVYAINRKSTTIRLPRGMSKKQPANDPRDKTLSGFFNAVDPKTTTRHSPNNSTNSSPKWHFAKNANTNNPPNPNVELTDRRLERSGTVVTVEYFQDKEKVEPPKKDDTFDNLARMSLTRTNSDSDLSRKSSSTNLIIRSSSFSDLSDVL